MTIQSKTETAASGHARTSLWQRLAPLLDMLGAVLIFGSWIFSHSLSQRAQDQAKTHQAIIDHVRQFRLYDDFAHRISDIQSDLARTRNLVEYATRSGNSLDGTAGLAKMAGPATESFPDAPTWTGMTETQVRELNDFVQSLGRYAGQLSSSGLTTQSIEAAKRATRELSKAFHSARGEYDRLVEKQNKSISLADNDVAAEEEELRKRVDRLWHNYDTAKQSMLPVSDDLLRTAAAQSESASQHAKHFQQLSYALYIVGTLIILFGRVKSVLGTKRAD